MKAMILAAGVGSRLDPLTRTLPKPLVPIVNKPVMEYLIELLKQHGVNEIVVNLHYLGDQIKDYFDDGSRWGVTIHWRREKRLWGDAGSVKRAKDFFQDDAFLVIGGDDLTDMNLTELVEFHRSHQALATLALTEVEDPSEYGIVLTNENGRITRFLEKPKTQPAFSNTANTGVYVFDPAVFDYIPSGFYLFGKQLFPTLMEAGKPLYGHITHAYWNDVGNLRIYKQTQKDVLQGKLEALRSLSMHSPTILMGENLCIDPTAIIGETTLMPPFSSKTGIRVAIGDSVTIRDGAQVLDGTIIGNHCEIESGVILRDCILWDGAVIKQNTHLEHCIVGKNCVVMATSPIYDGIFVTTIKKR